MGIFYEKGEYENNENCSKYSQMIRSMNDSDAQVVLEIYKKGLRKRVAKLDGKWRNTLILERRSNVIGN
jgi:hypothetical protein